MEGGVAEDAEGLYGSEAETFDLHRTTILDLCHSSFEVVGSFVGSEGLSITPSFAEHENIGACAALKHIVGDAAFMLPAGGGQGKGCLQSIVITTFVGLEKTIKTDHGGEIRNLML